MIYNTIIINFYQLQAHNTNNKIIEIIGNNSNYMPLNYDIFILARNSHIIIYTILPNHISKHD